MFNDKFLSILTLCTIFITSNKNDFKHNIIIKIDYKIIHIHSVLLFYNAY